MRNVSMPTGSTFVGRAKWAVARYMLSKIGSKRHELKFVVGQQGPGRLVTSRDPYDDFSGTSCLQRMLEFSQVGVLCSSGTQPSIREIVIGASFTRRTSLKFGGDRYAFRSGFTAEDDYGESDFWVLRKDFTEMGNRDKSRAELPTLKAGEIHYPFREAQSVLTHAELRKKYKAQFSAPTFMLADIEQDDVAAANGDFDTYRDALVVDIGVILDSDELLAFHWSPGAERFAENFYNAGLV